jgi:hypothetical protein
MAIHQPRSDRSGRASCLPQGARRLEVWNDAASGRDCDRASERGCGGGCWGIFGDRDTMVSGGRGYATIAFKAVGAAAAGTLLVVR